MHPLSLSVHLPIFTFFLLHAHALFLPLILFRSLFYSPASSYSTTTRSPLSPYSTLPHPVPPPPPQARRHHRGAAEDRAHWQARVAVTYCLLMECDKSCGNAGVRGSESQGVEYVSVPACVLASCVCVCVCVCMSARPHVFVPFLCLCLCVCLCVTS